MVARGQVYRPLIARCVVVSMFVVTRAVAQMPPRPLGKTVAAIPLNAWGSSVRELADGRVLVVDSMKRLVLLDSALRFVRVVARVVEEVAYDFAPDVSDKTGERRVVAEPITQKARSVERERVGRGRAR